MDNWLPARTIAWIERRWETPVSIEANSVTYDASWGGMRITRQTSGFAIHERGEKSPNFCSFVLWACDMAGLQKHLAWEHRSDWEDRTKGVHDLPDLHSLPPGFELTEDAQRKQYLSRKGRPVARLHGGPIGKAAYVHARLLTISLEDLEHAIQDPDGKTAAGENLLHIRPYAMPVAAKPDAAPSPKRRRFWPWGHGGAR